MPLRFPIDPVTSPLTPEAFRNQVQNLLLSYHAADTDFLAEILQNSIDALEDQFTTPRAKLPPKIDIEIDPGRKTVEISDNGPGISDDNLRTLGCPNFTSKTQTTRRGHKGVGLAFAAWSSKGFTFATKRIGETQIVSGKLLSGIDWIQTGSGKNPTIQAAKYDPPFLHNQPSGTVLHFQRPQEDRLTPLLDRLNDRGIETLFRMQTAVGFANLPQLDTEGAPPWVSRTIITISIKTRDAFRVPMGFYFPHEFFGDKLSYNIERLRDRDLVNLEKEKRLYGRMKCIYTVLDNARIKALFKGEEYSDMLPIVQQQAVTAYGAFLDEAATFTRWNSDLYRDRVGRGRHRYLIDPGIHFVTATMPAGEIVPVELGWGGGNKDRLFIVVQFQDVKPDVGRKTFERDVVQISQRIAAHLCRDLLVPNRMLLIPSEIPHGDTEHEQVTSLEELKSRAKAKLPLPLAGLGVSREPKTEQEVVALFSALVAAGHLKGYDLLSVFGSSEKYDAVFQYEISKEEGSKDPKFLRIDDSAFGKRDRIKFPASMLEFKPFLSHLIRDFEAGLKVFGEIRLAVAWDAGEEAAFAGSSEYRLEQCEKGSPREKQFYGETHFLTMTTGPAKIHVILLRDIVSALAT